MRRYFKSSDINYYERHNIWYFENGRLFLFTIHNKFEDYFSFCEGEIDIDSYVVEFRLNEITEEDAFLELFR